MEIVVAEAVERGRGQVEGLDVPEVPDNLIDLTGIQRLGPIGTAKVTTLPEAQGNQRTGSDI